jgi:hypothetical protein
MAMLQTNSGDDKWLAFFEATKNNAELLRSQLARRMKSGAFFVSVTSTSTSNFGLQH